jgi:hypothetical protein
MIAWRRVILASILRITPVLVCALSAPVALAAPATSPALPVAAKVDTTHAYLLHVPGIAGETQIDHTLTDGFKDGGFKGKVEIYDWTGKQKGIAALINHERNEKEAQKIADKIVEHRKLDPKGQILLTSHSGGTGLVIFALEKLPKDVMVDGVWLLSPALSPNYDLSTALSHIKGKLYCFSSTMDVLVLGLGTKVFGTIDGHKGESAGRVGFTKPEHPAVPDQYEKLVDCPYEKTWIRFGNIGDHVSVMSQAFAEHVLTPLVLSHLPGGGGPMTRPIAPVGPIKLPATQPDDRK